MAIWRAKRKREPDPDLEDARRRLADAERDLAAAKGDDHKVEELARRIHEIRRRNRFAAMMKQALGGMK